MVLSAMRAARRHAKQQLGMMRGRLGVLAGRAPALAGAYPDFATALAAVPKGSLPGYDHAEIADVAFDLMCRIAPWDYPVLLWLDRIWRPGLRVVDAGGHMGTKYIAFSRLLPVDEAVWTVLDLPGIVTAARARQAKGKLPAKIGFASDPAQIGAPDVLLASGLMQYLDVPFSRFLGRLPARPQRIILNKVATRDGPTVVTLERIGAARVPYHIRNRAGFEAELATLGYLLRDEWEIPSLSRTIATHPALGPSISRGYVLDRAD